MSDINTRFLTLRREVIKKYFSRMNNMQFKGVVTAEGPVLILAGAGSGKTTVLVNRIASLVKFGNAFNSDYVPPFVNEETFPQIEQMADLDNFENGGIFSVDAAKPWEILAITFTNKAAGELKERISQMLGDDGLDIWAGTFHSVCGRILRRFGDRIGYSSHFTIYDTDDSKRVMKEVYKSINLDEKMIPIKSTLNAISSAKDRLITPEQFISENAGDIRLSKIGKAYAQYQKALKEADAMDFDDMIVNTVKLFRESKEALDFYHRRFRYIMVDEYQDTNHAQYELVSLLAEKSRNICVVGDDDQSIYRFRGATIENILSFEDTYPDSTVIRLEQNYRSTSVILDAANAVIANNKARKGKNLWTAADGGDKIEVYTAPDEQSEASYVVDQILNSVARGGKYSDNAVLYRMNAQSNAIETAMVRAGLTNYRVVGGHRFYDRKEIKDVIAYLNVIANHGDRVRLTRIINEPKRGIGDTTVARAVEISDQTGLTLFEVFNSAEDFPPLQRAAKKLKEFCAMIEKLTEFAAEHSLLELFEEMLDKSGYTLSLIAEGKEGADRLDNVKELASSIAQYEKEHDDPSLSGFLEEVALISDIDQFDADADAVVLMTIHSAKGLEFNNVYLVGLEEGIFPGNQSVYGTEEDIEEERRLAYVAITRARQKLHISNAYTRMLYGTTSRNMPSRFLEEIPKELCNIKSVRGGMSAFGMGSADFRYGSGSQGGGSWGGASYGGSGSRYNSYGESRSEFDDYFAPRPQKNETKSTIFQKSQSAAKPKAAGGGYAVGQRVKHKAFGEGMILSSKPMGNDTLLEIAFDLKGTKKLMANFARLEKL